MTASVTPISRRRMTQDQSREAAMAAARALLVESGPQAVTLKAVASRIGRTHANLLHHFGSAAGLQKALSHYLCTRVCDAVGEAVMRTRTADASPRVIVDMAFDAFDREGAGALASWMILTGNEDALDPLVDTIHRLVDDLTDGVVDAGQLRDDTLALTLMAMGDALLGAPLAKALGLPRHRARDLAETMLMSAITDVSPDGPAG